MKFSKTPSNFVDNCFTNFRNFTNFVFRDIRKFSFSFSLFRFLFSVHLFFTSSLAFSFSFLFLYAPFFYFYFFYSHLAYSFFVKPALPYSSFSSIYSVIQSDWISFCGDVVLDRFKMVYIQ